MEIKLLGQLVPFIKKKNKYQFIPKNCLQHILLFIKTNTHVNTVLILLIIFPPIHQRLFFQNTNFFMQISKGGLEIMLLLQTIYLFCGVKRSNSS